MTTICFVSFEIYPTTGGGCGVLLHHAAELLLRRGHEVVFLLDLPRFQFERFDQRDRLEFTNAANCRAYDMRALSADMDFSESDAVGEYMFRSLRTAHALRKLLARERVDCVEFPDFAGTGYHSMVEHLYDPLPGNPVLAVRLHGCMELIDELGPTNHAGFERYRLYAHERAALGMAEVVLTPTKSYVEAYCDDRYERIAGRAVVSQPPKLECVRVSRRPDPKQPHRILFLGRIFHWKGVDELVQAAVALFRQRPDLPATMDLIGYDSSESPLGKSTVRYLRRIIPGDLQGRFEFSGQLSHEDISRRLEETLFAVFPSRFESFCYALHEVYDAGVPVIANRLPAFAEFFEHEKNALLYDGTIAGLLASMERMLDETALRESLSHPYPVAGHPLGAFYSSPKARSPIVRRAAAGSEALRVSVVVLCPEGPEAAAPTLESLKGQSHKNHEVICLVPDSQANLSMIWWLGRGWETQASDGTPCTSGELLTTDALLVLIAGDRLDALWLELCAGALSGRPGLGFAGTWARRGGRPVPSTLDIAPELHTISADRRLTRTLLRTEPRRLLVELFDSDLGVLGEIGYLWRAVDRWGPGCLYPKPMIELGEERDAAFSPHLNQYLVSGPGRAFARRWPVLLATLQGNPLTMLAVARTLASGGNYHRLYTLALRQRFTEAKARLRKTTGSTLRRLGLRL